MAELDCELALLRLLAASLPSSIPSSRESWGEQRVSSAGHPAAPRAATPAVLRFLTGGPRLQRALGDRRAPERAPPTLFEPFLRPERTASRPAPQTLSPEEAHSRGAGPAAGWAAPEARTSVGEELACAPPSSGPAPTRSVSPVGCAPGALGLRQALEAGRRVGTASRPCGAQRIASDARWTRAEALGSPVAPPWAGGAPPNRACPEARPLAVSSVKARREGPGGGRGALGRTRAASG